MKASIIAGRVGWRAPAFAALALVMAAAPLLLSPYAVTTLTRILVFALLALSLDLLVGFTGLPSLGHGAYFGTGAYAAAWVAIHASPSGPLTLAVAMAAGGAVALAAGCVAVRARGIFFLMLTLAIGEVVEQLAVSWYSVTGGHNGLYGVPAARLGATALIDVDARYWYVLAVFAAGAAAVRCIAGSALGDTLRGIRDNEARMRALGYRVYGYKLAAFVIAGAVAGLAGGLLAAHERLVTPADVGLGTSIMALLAVTIGGEGSLWGPCLGAAAVVLIRDALGPSLGGHGSLVLGLLFVVVVSALPGGLARALAARTRARS